MLDQKAQAQGPGQDPPPGGDQRQVQTRQASLSALMGAEYPGPGQAQQRQTGRPQQTSLPLVFHPQSQGFQELSRHVRPDQDEGVVIGNLPFLPGTIFLNDELGLPLSEFGHIGIEQQLHPLFLNSLGELPFIVLEDAAEGVAPIGKQNPVLPAQRERGLDGAVAASHDQKVFVLVFSG